MDLASQLRNAVISSHLPPPSSTFLTSLLTNRTPPPPLQSLVATAKSRLLSADLATSTIIDSSVASLPLDIDSPTVGEAKLPRDVHVQVMDVENLTISRWEQIEELEAVERGERTKGREIIRVSAEDENGTGPGDVGVTQTQAQGVRQAQASSTSSSSGNSSASAAGKNATHRLVLQDCKGKKIFAVELRRIDKIGVGKTHIGEKILLRGGTVVARGTALLTPENCVILGGKVDAWHKTWTEGRLARLKETVGGDRPRDT